MAAQGIEVPFLVNNTPKWISGIVEDTTCGDIVKALLASEGRLKGIAEDQLERFVLVERWRKVERPLRRESCLMKIWQAWGGEAEDVQFILKRVSSSGGGSKRPRTTRVRRSSSLLLKQLASWENKHPKAAAAAAGGGGGGGVVGGGGDGDTDSEVSHLQGNIQVTIILGH